MMLAIEDRLRQSGNGYITPIFPNDRNSTTLTIEEQGEIIFSDLNKFLLDNKTLYTNLYGENNLVPVDLIAFSQGF